MEGTQFEYGPDEVLVTKICPICNKKYVIELTKAQIKQYFTGEFVHVESVRETHILNHDICC